MADVLQWHAASLDAEVGGSFGPSGSTARISPARASASLTPTGSSTFPARIERHDNRKIVTFYETYGAGSDINQWSPWIRGESIADFIKL